MSQEANGEYRIPAEVMAALLPHFQQMGIQPPDVAKQVPIVNLGTPIRELGMQLGGLLARAGLYKFGPNSRLIALRDGKFQTMTPVWFCSWIEKHVKVVKTYKAAGGGSYDAEVSMGKDVAAKLLETDELLKELPRINAILPVRVPVERSGGHVELCHVGWDREAETYCTDEVSYDQDVPLNKATEVIERFCNEFPFAGREPGQPLWVNRSFLVHMLAMLGVFMRRLLPPGTVRPLIFYMANDQGSGKSLLVSMVLNPCFGLAKNSDLPMGSRGVNPEKFQALLETVAQSMKEFLWLDDVPSNVWSNALNRFITAPGHEGRKYGGNDDMFEAPNVTQVFMTGNMPEATRDLMQRALVCELFLAKASETVEHGFEMSALWLARHEQRADLLGALWAFVRHWVASGMITAPTGHKRAAEWSRKIGGVLAAAGVAADPFELPDLPTGGDRETEEWQKLLVILADEAEQWVADLDDKSYQIDMTMLVETARRSQLLVDIVGSEEDKPLKGNELKKLGRRLAKWRGREDMKTSSGRRFQFGKRKQASNWVYPVTWLDPWVSTGE